jgi:mannose-6-phosphate isomerase-like protein (cupin superfamily)
MHDHHREFHEPGEGERAGQTHYVVPETPYDEFVRTEGLPVYRGMGVHDVKELDLGPWARNGGNGAFLRLDGIEDAQGLQVLEVPARAVLEVERHLYEKIVLVVEGEGATEIWDRPGGRSRIFEWGPGALFNIPLNASHRFLSSTDSRVRLLMSTTAPHAINLYGAGDFVFANEHVFSDIYDGSADFFSYSDRLLAEPVAGRAMQVTNYIPDIVEAQLPRDGQRAPGSRRVEPHMAARNQYLFVAHYETGRYGKAHAHPGAAILVCVKGQGYTLAWPTECGTQPWRTGHGDRVQRQDYVAGGMVVAAPGGGDWYHQHFGVGSEPLRQLVFYGTKSPFRFRGHAGETVVSQNANLSEGGRSIDYPDEDPFVAEEFRRMMRETGGRA